MVRARRLVGLLSAAGVFCAGGCETLGQDLTELTQALRPVTPSQAAMMMVDPHDADNRFKGTIAIANSPFGGAEAYVNLYRDRAKRENNALVLAASITALGRHGEADDAKVVAARLADENSTVRWEAAKALQRLHDPVVVPDLLRTLRKHDEDAEVRYACAVALGQYPQDRVFQGLVHALDAVELSVNMAARDSLGILTGQDHGLDPRAWLEWYNQAEAPFVEEPKYLYPTYQREQSWLEKLAFWSSPIYEQPGTPAGMAAGARRTYPDSEPAEHESGG